MLCAPTSFLNTVQRYNISFKHAFTHETKVLGFGIPCYKISLMRYIGQAKIH